MNKFQIATLLALSLMVLGAADIESKVRPGFNRKIDQVFIVLTSPQENNPSIPQDPKTALEEGFSKWNIKKSVFVSLGDSGEQYFGRPCLTSGNFTPHWVECQEKAGFAPLYILRLHVGCTEVRHIPKGTFGRKNVHSIQANLIEASSGQPIWKAEYWDSISSNLKEDYKDLAVEIMKRIEKDNLIRESSHQ